MSEVPVRLEMLMAHRQWVRRVARALVSDENEAADLEQNLWVKVLERPPRVHGSLRGWLARTIRNDFLNLKRGESRRASREERVARPEAQKSSVDVVAEGEAHQRVVNAVMALAEPYRSTVLFRYFEDLSPSEIASRQGEPVETVRTRLKRALAMLRERFDATSQGDRNAWCMALLPLVREGMPAGATTGLGVSTALTIGGAVMKASTKFAIAAALLATGGVVYWALSSGPSDLYEGQGTEVGAAPLTEDGHVTGGNTARTGSPPRSEPTDTGPTAPPVPADESRPPAPAGREPDPEPVQTFAPAGEVSGHVRLLGDRSPVEGATLSLRDTTPAAEGRTPFGPGTRKSDVAGEFRFDGVPAGEYELTASKEGFAVRTLRGLKVTDVGGVGGLEVLLTSGGSLEGLATDARGDPVPGLHVRTLWGGPPAATFEATTGEDGMYHFGALPPGRHTVEAVRGPGQVQRTYVSVIEGETVRVDFPVAATLTGSLLDARGGAVPGAFLTAWSSVGGKQVNREGKTDESGRFRLENLELGEWKIMAKLEGEGAFAAEVGTVTITQGEQDVVLRFEGGGIAGRVFASATKRPLTGQEVQISLYRLVPGPANTWNLGDYTGMARAGEDGSFAFRGLGPGRYRLCAYPKGLDLRKFEREVELAVGETKEGFDISLEAAERGTVRFAVRDPEGKPLEAVRFASKGAKNEVTTFSPESPAPGVYVAGLEGGPQHVILGREDLKSEEVSVEVVPGKTVQVDVTLEWGGIDPASHASSGEVAGQVFRRSTRKGLSSREVALSLYGLESKGGADNLGKFVAAAVAGPDGKFRFRKLKPGKYRVIATPQVPGLLRGEADVDLPDGRNAEGVEIGLDEGRFGKVRLVVRDGAGNPVQGVTMSTRESTESGHTYSVTTSMVHLNEIGAGVYEATLEAGTRKLVLSGPGFEAETVTVDVIEGDTVESKVVMKSK